MIHLGVSGWSYDDWIGPVYPADLPRREWLAFIAQQVDAIEVNVTFYRIPQARMVQGWADRTPEHFLFAAKAHRSLTHDRTEPDFSGFLESLKPLAAAGKLACVLAQFPYSFHATQESREYLLRLADAFRAVPTVVEFRNRKWITEETFDLLEETGLGYCSLDQPRFSNLVPPIARATSAIGYVRLHGRNAEKWWRHEQAWERYDYTYSDEELREWVPKLRSLESSAPTVLVLANNHYRGQSLDTVRKLRALLEEEQSGGE